MPFSKSVSDPRIGVLLVGLGHVSINVALVRWRKSGNQPTRTEFPTWMWNSLSENSRMVAEQETNDILYTALLH